MDDERKRKFAAIISVLLSLTAIGIMLSSAGHIPPEPSWPYAWLF